MDSTEKIRFIEGFWNWFIQHEMELLNFEIDQERIFDELASELQKVDSYLTFEFGPREARREFVISAGGIRSAFPAVTSLVEAAPDLKRWRVTAFRPRRALLNVVEFRGIRVDPDVVQFSLVNDGKVPGVYLFIPAFREEDSDWKQVGYLLLDESLGEYDVESRLGFIKMLSTDALTNGERFPLSKLPTLFDQLALRLEGKCGKSS